MNDFEKMGALVADRARENEEHRKSCEAVPCTRCNRTKCRGCGTVHIAECGWFVDEPLCNGCERRRERKQWESGALRTIPRAFDQVTLASEWLVKLVGAPAIALATASLSAERVAFVGAAGTGKTSLAVAMFHAAIKASKPDANRTWRIGSTSDHLYVSAFALAKAQGNAPLGKEADLVSRALDAPLVLIDELGGEDPRYGSTVKEVIYERHANARPTWVTTGVGAKEIASRYGGGISRKTFEDAVVFDLGRK